MADHAAELAAMRTCADALIPLDKHARSRVLRWLEQSLGKEADLQALVEELAPFFEQIKLGAERLGVTDSQLVHAISAIRERGGVAPIADRDLSREEAAAEDEAITRAAKGGS